MVERKPGELVQLKVRVPHEVRVSVEEASKRRGVAISTEVADRLKWSLEREELLPEVLALKFDVGPAGLVMAVADVMEQVGWIEMEMMRRRNDLHPTRHQSWADSRHSREHALLAGMALLALMRPLYAGLRPAEAVETLMRVIKFVDELKTVDQWSEKMPKEFLPGVPRDEAKRAYQRHKARMQGIRNLMGPEISEELPYKSRDISDLVNAFRSIAQLVEDVQHQAGRSFRRE